MSTWTSKLRLGAVGILLAALSGCGSAPNSGVAQGAMIAGPPSAAGSLTRLAVADGAVVIAGPKGFCVDRRESRLTPMGGFVFMGSCAVVRGGLFRYRPARPAILTASVGGPVGPNLTDGAADALRTYFRSNEGRAALSRSGDARTVTVLEDQVGAGAFLLYLRDVSRFPGGVAAPEYWRAVFDVGGRMIVLSAYGVQPGPLDRDEGLQMINAFVNAVRSATPAAAVVPVWPAPVVATANASSVVPASPRPQPRP
jgi:hypothetical protein